MTPEERSLLERTAALAKENNTLLRSIRRSSRISLAMRIGYWVLIILISLGAYYLIQPYVEAVGSLMSSSATEETVTENPSFMDRFSAARSLLQ